MPTTSSTPLSLVIRTHYQLHDAESGDWTMNRAKRLCGILKISVVELSELIRIPPHLLKEFLTGERRMPKVVRLVLDLVERSTHAKYLGKQYERSLFPEL